MTPPQRWPAHANACRVNARQLLRDCRELLRDCRTEQTAARQIVWRDPRLAEAHMLKIEMQIADAMALLADIDLQLVIAKSGDPDAL